MTTKIALDYENEMNHQSYLNGFEDGLLYNRGLGYWESWDDVEPVDDYYRRGFKEATGIEYSSKIM